MVDEVTLGQLMAVAADEDRGLVAAAGDVPALVNDPVGAVNTGSCRSEYEKAMLRTSRRSAW